MIKKAITLLIFTGLHLCSVAQKCEVKKDPFDGTTTKEYAYSLYGIDQIRFVRKSDNTVLLTYRYATPGIKNATFPKGSPLLMKLKNKETIELSTIKEATTKTGAAAGAGYGTAYTEVFFVYQLNSNQLRLLSENLVHFMKHADFDGEPKTHDLKKAKSYTNHFKSGAKCMLQ